MDESVSGLVSELCRQMLGRIHIGLLVFDDQMRVLLHNEKADEILSIQPRADRTLADGTDMSIWQDWNRELSASLTANKNLHFDSVHYRHNNKTRCLRICCYPFAHPLDDGKKIGILIFEDRTEDNELQRQLADSERLAALGKMASKVAHELNNPLDGVLRYINLAIRSAEQANFEKITEYLGHCRDGLNRVMHISSELLEFSRSTYNIFDPTPIGRIIDDAIKVMQPAAQAAAVRITKIVPEPSPAVRGPNLFQVFCNLIKNAIDAMPDGGSLTITCSSDKDRVTIEFQDSGYGIDANNIDSIFEPFFTTKAFGKGTGLGLAVCRDIIEKYGGRIGAKNAPHGGSIFTIYIPLEKDLRE